MAPVPVEHEVNYSGVALVALHYLSIIFFSKTVASSLDHSSRTLPVSQHVKDRLSKRRQLSWIFYGLALFSLTLAASTALHSAALSFSHWCRERRLAFTPGAFDSSAFDSNFTSPSLSVNQRYGFYSSRLRWLQDTPIYHDAFEILAEKARRFWWGQQVELALVPWSLFLALEGRRRGIAHLYAFLAVAHLVNLSFAQNAFFMALILTPVPLPNDRHLLLPTRWNRLRDYLAPVKPRNWSLKPGYLLAIVMLSYASIYALPFVAGSPFFNPVLLVSRCLTFAPLLLQTTAPAWMGIILPQKPKAVPAFTNLFRFMAVMTLLLHGLSTFRSLTYNMPHAHYHRHSKSLPWDMEERSRWERTTSAVGKLLGALHDHPVVAGVGYDVLVSGLTMGLWAALRPLGAADILSSVVPLYNQSRTAEDEESLDHESAEVGDASLPGLENAVSRTRSGKTPKARGSNKVALETPSKMPAETPGPRRRGRPRKVRAEPEEQPGKALVENPGDETYKPTLEEKVNAPLGDPPAQEYDTEAAALAWGLTAVGGLALGSTGVLGSEFLW